MIWTRCDKKHVERKREQLGNLSNDTFTQLYTLQSMYQCIWVSLSPYLSTLHTNRQITLYGYIQTNAHTINCKSVKYTHGQVINSPLLFRGDDLNKMWQETCREETRAIRKFIKWYFTQLYTLQSMYQCIWVSLSPYLSTLHTNRQITLYGYIQTNAHTSNCKSVKYTHESS